MSDNIPFEIQTDIMLRIPDTKSLLRWRSVSKAWKSMIDSKKFVTAHTLRLQANRHLLLGKADLGNTQVNYVSIVDDDTFPHQKLNVFFPDSVDKSNHLIIGTSHGLFCLFDSKTIVIWNPSIRKTVATEVPIAPSELHLPPIFGFGVCPSILDPKIVKITHVLEGSTEVEVFTLTSGGTWRSPLSSSVCHQSVIFGKKQAVIDRFIYWIAQTKLAHGLIMSFDLTSEEFTKVNLPDDFGLDCFLSLSLYNLRESLVVHQQRNEICHVWMMTGHGCTRSFNKLYSINATDVPPYGTLGFRKSGAHIVYVKNDKKDRHKRERALAIYEPESKSNTTFGIYGAYFSVHSYMETLLLLGH